MLTRYRICDLAKDFNMPSEKLLEILNIYIGSYKNDYCILREKEIGMVFDVLTKQNSVKSFKSYLEIGAEERMKAEKMREDEKNRKLLEQMAILEQLKAAAAAQNGEAPEKQYNLYTQREDKKYTINMCNRHSVEIQPLNYINRPGEKDVEYVIKWFMATQKDTIISIAHDCESKYSSNCILLNNPEFLNDPQEYDHILVTKSGIIIIETKHWEGNIQIRPDKKWIKEKDGDIVGLKSPDFQMKRHEILMKSIFPNTPVHSILCFSNPTVIVDGAENITDYPVITIEQLSTTLSDLCDDNVYGNDDIKNIVGKGISL
jgi:hypothetical protein